MNTAVIPQYTNEGRWRRQVLNYVLEEYAVGSLMQQLRFENGSGAVRSIAARGEMPLNTPHLQIISHMIRENLDRKWSGLLEAERPYLDEELYQGIQELVDKVGLYAAMMIDHSEIQNGTLLFRIDRRTVETAAARSRRFPWDTEGIEYVPIREQVRRRKTKNPQQRKRGSPEGRRRAKHPAKFPVRRW